MEKTRFKIVPILEGHFHTEVPSFSSKMHCPFHDDENPSAWVNEEFQYFKCFGCGVRGDAIGLLHYQGGLSFADAYARAEELAGAPDVAVPRESMAGVRLSGGSRADRGKRNGSSTRRGR